MTTAYTPEEIREKMLNLMRVYAKSWAEYPNMTPQERCDGLAFSILGIFDGITGELPAFDIVTAPHPDDKDYHIKNGNRYVEPGTIINDCHLHDEYYKKE